MKSKRTFRKKPRRKYPSVQAIEQADAIQLQEWLDTLTYPGHGINSRREPKKFAVVKAAEQQRRRLIAKRLDKLKKGEESNGIDTRKNG